MKKYEIPETPWDLIAEQRNLLRKLWNREQAVFDLKTPIISIDWKWAFAIDGYSFGGNSSPFGGFSIPEARVKNADLDLRCQLEAVRHGIECLKASADVGSIMCNTPALDLIHFGTGPLATAFGAKFIMTPCDTAGPWSIATSIWHYEDILEAINTAPDVVHYVLNLVTETIIEWYNLQEASISRWGRTHSSFSSPWMPRGIGIGDDVMVTVSPKTWENFFLPYNNRLSREYGNMITYHCCMKYDTHFESIAKTDGFAGFDASPEYNDFDKIEATLSKYRVIWTQQRGPEHLDQIKRLKGKVGMLFGVSADTREEAVKKSREFIKTLQEL